MPEKENMISAELCPSVSNMDRLKEQGPQEKKLCKIWGRGFTNRVVGITNKYYTRSDAGRDRAGDLE